jgi:hypothetical protein
VTNNADSVPTLNLIEIPSPCEVPWSQMSGDHRSRFCQTCSKRVYNLAAMRSDEALAMLNGPDGGVCVRVYRRRDGTVLTSDCPKGRPDGLKWVYRRAAPAASMVAAAFAVAAYVGSAPVQAKPSKEKLIYIGMDIDLPPPPPLGGIPLMPPPAVAAYHSQEAAPPALPDPGKSEVPPWEGQEST